jgi:Ca2+-binding RTX toxin-like protein
LAESWRNLGEAAGDSYDSIEGLHGSAHNDVLTGSSTGNDLYGHSGNDDLFGLDGADYLSGGTGNDNLTGGVGADGLDGGAGFDLASYHTAGGAVVANLSNAGWNSGEAAGDVYTSIEGLGGSGYSDHLTGNAGNNDLYGWSGDDQLFGLDGIDRLFGHTGSDNLVGGWGADTLDGGDGYDYAGYFTATSGVVADLLDAWRNTGEAAGDSYIAIEGIGGSAYNDELLGSHGGNELYGNGGGDTLEGRGGADLLHGGAGYDYASYFSSADAVTANLSESWRNTGEATGDRYVSIEALHGSQYGDVLTGNQDGNSLYGHSGNDQLRGLNGRDWMVGGGGDDLLSGGNDSDWLTGGAGSDIFRFDAALNAWNVDEIADFTVGVDKLQLDRNVFWAFTYQGAVEHTQFTIGTAATSASHRLIYNSATGAVSYDADGTGGATAVQFATIGKYQNLQASDFSLIWA